MRLVSVTAVDFGPLVRQSLGLAPGLTVVVGGNESGKSSWHAACYAALCGRRRSRGRPNAADQRFIDAHRPWSGGPWQTRARLQLDDGREIELSQELAGLVDCRAVDLGLARDVSAEIMHDGSPDASVWCGLTRDTLRATACVEQGELASVVEASDGVQQALQRAVSVGVPAGAGSAGDPGTAAAAIAALEVCRREAVGRETATSIRPLRRALDELAAAQHRVAAAQAQARELAELAERRESAAAELARRPAPEPAGRDTRPEADEPMRPEVGSPVPPPVASVLLGVAVLLALLGVVASGAVRAGMLAVAAAALLTAVMAWRHTRTERKAPSVSEQRSGREPEAARHAEREAALRRRHEAQLRLVAAEAELSARSGALTAADVRPLAVAEEQLAAARAELARVRTLDETLELTIGFLGRAQEQVHREVAPELSALISARLSTVTGGRYTAARIDPAGLAVELRDASGTFRPVRALSHGTREQLYLLLRVALVELLTAGHDSCPLLLDDVTVHADPDRTDALLEVLLQIAGDRQVVLFAHQDQVRAWASARLDGVRHALVELEPPGAGPPQPRGAPAQLLRR